MIQFTGMNEQADASFNSRVYSSFLEAGCALKPTEATSLEPTVSVRQSHLAQDAFTETGAPGLDLSVGRKNLDSLVSDVGIRVVETWFEKKRHPLSLGLRTGWDHEFLNTDNSIAAQFADEPGNGNFIVQGTPRDRNAAALGLDGNIRLTRSTNVFLNYSTMLSSMEISHSLVGGIKVKW
jgi:outer membrane autotransporter protein